MASIAPATDDALVAGFTAPPAEARPLVFWQWVNGNVSEAGIREDLRWMARIGLGGAFVFDIGFASPLVPQFVARRVGFGSPEWSRAVHVAGEEAHRLGLTLGAQSGGGWSVSGDAKVLPADAMKKLVWSETAVTDSDRVVRLKPLPVTSGPFLDLPGQPRWRNPELGGEIATIAYRLSNTEVSSAVLLRASGVVDATVLNDGSYARAAAISPDSGGNVRIRLEYARAIAPTALRLSVDGAFGSVEVTDGRGRRRKIFSRAPPGSAPVRTLAFDAGPSKLWTLTLTKVLRPVQVREAALLTGRRIDGAEDKGGFGTATHAIAVAGRAGDDRSVTAASVIDVTDRVRAGGVLDWRPPPGRWIVQRFGWSLTGRRSVPATVESGGLEVDKLDAAAVRRYAERFYDRYLGAVAGGRMDAALTDSWEAGTQTWSPTLRSEFSKRRGYDPRPWLPALTGRVVQTTERSERFLADWRRTIADVIADSHYGIFAAVLRDRGLTYYAEAPGTDRPATADPIQAKRRVDVPMGEFWYWPEGRMPKPEHVADVREAASAAHLGGRRVVAAEALTTMGELPWATGPADWRRAVDRFFTEGVNRIVLHTSVHQPFTDPAMRPGITLRQYGQHFTRNDSWAALADGWIGYLARTSFLLQQGTPVADIAVFYGEDVPGGAPPGFVRPSGYDYDFVDREALLAMSVSNAALIWGRRKYRALIVVQGERMSVPVLRQLHAFAAAGGLVIGPPPVAPFGLGDDERAFARLREAIWGKHLVRSGAVLTRRITPDVIFSARARPLDWTHRVTPSADIYFFSNSDRRPFDGRVCLRGSGPRDDQSAELWNAEDGRRVSLSSARCLTGTIVRLRLPAGASRFVLLRRGGAAPAPAPAPEAASGPPIQLRSGWRLRFLDGMGTRDAAMPTALGSWSDAADPAIRYYSGRAIYSRMFDVPMGRPKPMRLDLGEVGDMARVRLNGADLGVVWWKPAVLRLDGLKAGTNRLEIEVASFWHNRLVGDQQPGARRYTFASIQPHQARTPLRRSGLIGPVVLTPLAPETSR